VPDTATIVAADRRGAKGSARERLLAAANDLFYAEGVQTVGIDRIIEQAGVAKASLYNTFGSKENLVRAYLVARHQETLVGLQRAVDRHTDPRRRLLAVFDAQAELFADPGFRGCAFITASAEAPDGGVIQGATDDFRAEVRSLFTKLARDAGAPDPARLGRQLQLLYDGGGVSAQLDRDPHAAAAGRAAAEVLVGAALG
jgi:AcrR family transcriptional regulator